ncbi:MAG: hypothetical protein K9N49_10660, partial [Candidatus Marinimicrobia bacterium]|nr:hypothetical protein [Candidatus Neomarinimicrobiota bacterium]
TAPGPPPAERQPEREADLARLFGGLPVALVRAPTALWEAALTTGEGAAPLRPVVRQALQIIEAEEIVAVLLTDEYGGSLRGIRLPMLVLAVPSPGPAPAQENMTRLLDQLNRRWGWGLVPGPLPERTSGLPPAFSIEATTGGFYGGLPPAERVAYAVTPHWMLLASNAKGLTALLRRYPTPAAEANARHAPWTAHQPGQPPLGPAWAAWPRVAQAGRQALGAYMLKLLFEDPEGSRLARVRLQTAQDWLQTLAPLGTGRLHLTGDARWQVTFRMQSELETERAAE